MKTVGIIGSGNVGKALAHGFVKLGYKTYISSRKQNLRDELEEELNGKVVAATPEEAAKQGQLIVFAVKGTAAREALKTIGIHNLEGKTVIDTTNPIDDAAPENGVLRYFTDINKSLMEELQEMAPKANFVKAFSSVGSLHMVHPQFDDKPTMFICGQDQSAKKEVKALLEKFGWETQDMGFMEAARAIEPLAMLWCIPGFQANSWNHAFKMLKK
jgi:8-hydroxy-5-deazaflavin:NADPH oxidoreductase